MKFLKKNHFTDKAQAIVEFAIVLPILLLLVYGLIETGRLLFIYSSVNNASRQAVRYGSTTGIGSNGVQRFEDCEGIREAAQRVDFLNAFEDGDILITYDQGDVAANTYDTCDGSGITGGSTTIDDIPENPGMRVTVTIDANFTALVPNLVPFISRPLQVISSRTLLQSVEVLPDLEDTETIIVSDLPDPSEIGEPVTVTVTVTGPTLIPTGAVAVTANDGTTCTVTLSGGTGSCDMTFLTAGTKSIIAAYTGDADHNPSSSTSESHTVNKSATVTTIISHAPEPSEINESVAVTVTVTGGLTTPTGTVDITGADTNCTATLDASGTGSCNVVFSSDGLKTIIATYSGDTDHATSNKSALHNVIKDKQTVTYITSDNPDPSQAGQAVNVSVTVAGLGTIPTGDVTVTTSDGQTCTISLSGGSGSCSVTFTTVGAKTIFASYTSDDADHDGSSDSEPHSVDLPPTTTTITAHTPDPSNVGQAVAVTVTVTGGASTPTGTVSITGAGTICTITLAGGTGSCNVTFNSSGSKTISADYNGDSTHATSSDTASHTVTSIPPVSGCNSTNITTGSLQLFGDAMTMSITNNTTAALAIGDITITWNHDKGHQTGSDKTLRLQGASVAGTTFWTGDQAGNIYTIVPATTAYVPASATSLFVFTFHQSYDNLDSTESVTLSFSNPGCEGFTITQN
ncbi:MAG TPA: Ig-like domain repeat protein [Anaerolineales bacterium]|nr:Ig-like domain repeat protein [Anaerolineales bacterium]